MSITEQDLASTYKNGQYSNPAWKRYGCIETNVICDRCRKTNLKVCVGHGKIDLCLNCVMEMQKLEERDKIIPGPIMSDSPPLTFMMQDQFRNFMPVPMMMQSQFRSPPTTLMAQSQFRPSSSIPTTAMMQYQFRQNNDICEENILDKISKPEEIDRRLDNLFNGWEKKSTQ